MNIFETLATEAGDASLEFLIIGGHAVNSHGYHRTTLDIDVLIKEEQLAAWKELVTRLGYIWGHETKAFVQFKEPEGTDQFPLDLMVVDASTFEKLMQNSVPQDFGNVALRVPRILDLIALKLHALRSSHRAASGKDLPDVIALIRLSGLDLSNPEMNAILNRYATEPIKDEIYRQFLQ